MAAASSRRCDRRHRRRSRRVARRLSGDALHGRAGELPCIVVGDPVELAAEAGAAALRSRRSWRWARPWRSRRPAARSAGAVLAAGAARSDEPVVVADERLADLALRAAPDVVAALRARALEPLASETPRSRSRLSATLASWLRHAGARAAVAEELGVHPQTVRYRVTRLRELFGPRLDDPEARFELMLALRPLAAASIGPLGVGRWA